jgi:hypothetical protein
MKDMETRTSVLIDLSALAQRLGVPIHDATDWLTRNGFLRDGEFWRDKRDALHVLHAREIMQLRRRNTETGVTFIQITTLGQAPPDLHAA